MLPSFVMTIIGILITAFLVDWVLKEDKAVAWRKATAGWWSRLDTLNWRQLRISSNIKFLRLFDVIYGATFISRKRIIASVISTVLGFTFVVGVLGWRNTILNRWIVDTGWFWKGDFSQVTPRAYRELVTILLTPLLNLIPDYLSLQETRWVLYRCAGRRSPNLFKWFVIDLVATSLIFLLVFILLVDPLLIGIWGSGSPLRVFGRYMEYLVNTASRSIYATFELEGILIFFLTTFFTSVLWILFLFFAVFVRTCQLCSPFLRILLSTMATSESPARSAAGFLCVFVAVAYGILWLVMNVILPLV